MSHHGIDRLFKTLREQRRPPVEQWNPNRIGEIDIRIARNGDWYHEGSPIRRSAMVRLFSSVLRRDRDDYFLVTPHEKLRIAVDDAPFTAIDLDVLTDGGRQYLVFTNNVDDRTIAGEAHPIFAGRTRRHDSFAPYIAVRDGLNALVVRSVYYRMAEYCVERNGQCGVWSDSQFFALDKIGNP